ncbi:MAG: DUF2244 domain-containing protein, partial [Stellaceae bacterium]
MGESREPAEPSTAVGYPVFERVLLPYRSLQPHGFYLLMLILGLFNLGIGIGFLAIGAWPVFGFCGLDVALVYV